MGWEPKMGWEAVEDFLLNYAAETDPEHKEDYFVSKEGPFPEVGAKESMWLIRAYTYENGRSLYGYRLRVHRMNDGTLTLSHIGGEVDVDSYSDEGVLATRKAEYIARTKSIASALERATGLPVNNVAKEVGIRSSSSDSLKHSHDTSTPSERYLKRWNS